MKKGNESCSWSPGWCDELRILEFWRTKFVLALTLLFIFQKSSYIPLFSIVKLHFKIYNIHLKSIHIWNAIVPVWIQLHWICKSMSSSPLFMNSLKREITGLMQHQDLILQDSKASRRQDLLFFSISLLFQSHKGSAEFLSFARCSRKLRQNSHPTEKTDKILGIRSYLVQPKLSIKTFGPCQKVLEIWSYPKCPLVYFIHAKLF